MAGEANDSWDKFEGLIAPDYLEYSESLLYRDFLDYEPGEYWGQLTTPDDGVALWGRENPYDEPTPLIANSFPAHEGYYDGDYDEWLGIRVGPLGRRGKFICSKASRWTGWTNETNPRATPTHIHRRELDEYVQVNFAVKQGTDLLPVSWLFTYERAGEWYASGRPYVTTRWCLLTVSPAVLFEGLETYDLSDYHHGSIFFGDLPRTRGGILQGIRAGGSST